MTRTALRAVAVALLIVVAGCGGAAPGGDGSPDATTDSSPTATRTATATPAATPTSTATTTPPSPDATPYPAGWSETGVNDTDAALESHYRAVLSGPSATVTYRSRVLAAADARAANTTLTMRVDTGARRLHASIDGRESHREAFFAGGTLSEWSVPNETVVGRSNTTFVRVAQSVDDRVLKSQLLLYRLRLNERVSQGGVTVFVYDVAGVYENAVSRRYGAAVNGTGRVAITARGRVVDLDTTVRYTDGEVSYTYTQTRIGDTTVSTPDWARPR
jgi:hypothetical protein